jgi:hypothetical protein
MNWGAVQIRTPESQGLSSNQPSERGGEVDGGQEGSRGLVVASGDGAKKFEFGEEAFASGAVLQRRTPPELPCGRRFPRSVGTA